MTGRRASSRQKDHLEHALVHALQRAGFAAAAGGDLLVSVLGVDRRARCRAKAKGFRELYSGLDGADVLIVRAGHAEPLVIVPFRFAVEIAKAAENCRIPGNAPDAFRQIEQAERQKMSDELSKTNPHAVDGFEGFEDRHEGDEQSQGGGVIQGTVAKFTNEATYVTRDDEDLPPDLELIANDIVRVVQKWIDGLPVETRILKPGEKFPNLEALNEATPKSEWAEGPDGKKRGPCAVAASVLTSMLPNERATIYCKNAMPYLPNYPRSSARMSAWLKSAAANG